MPLVRFMTRHFGIGRRGTVLVLFGLLWIGQGVGAMTAPVTHVYVLLDHGMVIRGVVWMLTGAVAVFNASRRQGDDGFGFVALYVMPAYQLLACIVAWAAWLGDKGGTGRALVPALIWVVVITTVMTIAGWREHPDVRRP